MGVFGRFNHQTSAQLLFREAKCAVELRRGDLIFFPSGSVTHSNAPLSELETRRSIAFYTAGGNFRYIAQGGQKALVKSSKEKKEEDKLGEIRWDQGWKLYNTYEELMESCGY